MARKRRTARAWLVIAFVLFGAARTNAESIETTIETSGQNASVVEPVQPPGAEWPQLRADVSVSETHADEMKAGIDLFKAEVRSILKARCLVCHDQPHQLDFSTRSRLLAACLKRNLLTARHFLTAIETVEDHQPEKIALSSKEREQFRKWWELGFPYDRPLSGEVPDVAVRPLNDRDRDFWSLRRFRPVVIPNVVDKSQWCQNEIDQFVLAKLEAAGIEPNPIAAPNVLARRAYFDLIGLPPKPSAIEALERRLVSYPELVDQLLGASNYGERAAQHWLATIDFRLPTEDPRNEQASFAAERSDRYLAFLIRAFNTDQPFDEFLRWQLAGDKLASHELHAADATAFLGSRVLPTQSDLRAAEQARYDMIDEAVSNTSRVFLGLSVGCARCHDHLTDPISTRDYYGMATHFQDLALQLGGDTNLAETDPIHQLIRGDLDQKHHQAAASYLSVFLPSSDGASESELPTPGDHGMPLESRATAGDRVRLARWMTDAEAGAGHLVARVIVNRVWEMHFGRGLVESADNFGRTGRRPSHPELLEYLSRELVSSGWKLKPLHRLIMTSATYQQSSRFDRKRARLDRSNELYWRRSPRPLESIVVRDAMLSVSGLLEERVYGNVESNGLQNKRSVYAIIRDSKLIPLLIVFSPPAAVGWLGSETQQAWSAGNAGRSSEQDREAALQRFASSFAKQLLPRVRRKRGHVDYLLAIKFGYQTAFGRSPTASELVSAEQLIKKRIQSANGATAAAERNAMEEFCRALLNSNEFRYVP